MEFENANFQAWKGFGKQKTPQKFWKSHGNLLHPIQLRNISHLGRSCLTLVSQPIGKLLRFESIPSR